MTVGIGLEAIAVAVLRRFAAAYTQCDIDALLALFATEQDVVVLDAGATSAAVGPAEVRTHFIRALARPERLTWTWERIVVTAVGSALCLTAEASLHGAGESARRGAPRRLTAVLEDRGGWAIRLLHLSAPIAAAGGVRPDVAPAGAAVAGGGAS